MARSWQYSRWRRSVMQAVMWLILGATVGLAALVSRYRAGPGAGRGVRLEPTPRLLNTLLVRLPQGWPVNQVTGQSRLGPSIALIAHQTARGDNADDPPGVVGRTLTVSEEPYRHNDTLSEFLGRQIKGEGNVSAAAPLTIAGQPGLLVAVALPDVGDGQVVTPGWAFYACAFTPWGRAVTLRLGGLGAPSRDDRDDLRLVADSVAPALQSRPLPTPDNENVPKPTDDD